MVKSRLFYKFSSEFLRFILQNWEREVPFKTTNSYVSPHILIPRSDEVKFGKRCLD